MFCFFVLFCFVLFCFVLFCFVLFCFVLSFVLFCFVLFVFYFVLFCFVLFCFVLFFFVLFVFCFVLFCFVLFCLLFIVCCFSNIYYISIFSYPFLGARKKLDVLYLQSKTFNVVVAKTAGKMPAPKALVSWIESFKSSASVEELPEVFPQSSNSTLQRSSSLLSPPSTPSATPSATPIVAHLPLIDSKKNS